ncbi:glutamine--tRNA ligase [Tanacetum coccineum]
MVASFPSDISLKCLVFYACTAEKLMELCEKFALVNVPRGGILARTFNSSKRIRLANPLGKFVENKGYILNLDGYLVNDEVIDKVQLMAESDKNYEYIAFEKMDGTLTDHVSRLIDKVPMETKVIRDVVKALSELHAGGVLHSNICPENVTLSTSTRGYYIVKLCGLGMNIKFSHGVMSSSCFKDNDILSDYEFHPFSKHRIKSEYGKDLKKAGPIAAYIVEKLMNPSYRLTLLIVYHHVLFWNRYDKILFLKEASDEIFARSLPDIEYLAGEVFEGDWKVEEDWLSVMSKVPEETRVMKKALDEMNSSEREMKKALEGDWKVY